MSIPQEDYLYIPNTLENFIQTNVSWSEDGGCNNSRNNGRDNIICIEGIIKPSSEVHICPLCQHHVHINSHVVIKLKHLPFGNHKTHLNITRNQYLCPHCHYTFEDYIPFKANNHYITKQLEAFIIDLLSYQRFTLRGIARLVGVHECIIRDIDKKRLEGLYTEEDEFGKRRYKVPSNPVKYLGIDEFSLHRHHRYATIIIDLATGKALYIAEGRKKQVVYDFIELVGLDFMADVKAVACDMNSDFEEAFKEKCPHLTIVYDHFHIVKNFNEAVINKVRQDAYFELCREHKYEEAALLKNSKYLLIANRENLNDTGISKLDRLLASNQLLLTAALIKAEIKYAFTITEPLEMSEVMECIIDICNDTKNRYFLRFAKLLKKHLSGIISHAKYHISTGRLEGINNKIKTIRRASYGFRDDNYFFLKIIDSTYKTHEKM